MTQQTDEREIPPSSQNRILGYIKDNPDSKLLRLLSFGTIGGLTTIGYALAFFIFRHYFDTQLSNVLSLALMTVINIYANRRFTYRRKGKEGVGKHYATGVIAFTTSWLISGIGLHLLHQYDPTVSHQHESLAAAGLTLVGTAVKLVVFSFGFRQKTE
jgi:putative flippase GtrA